MRWRNKLVVLCLALYASSLQAAEYITAIDIEGLERTRERTVLRQLPFAVGDEWHADDAATGERWLRNTGLFSEVHITPPDAPGHVHIRLHERWSLWLLPQLSRSADGATATAVSMDEYNLWGLQHHLHLAWRKETGKNFSGAGGNAYELGYQWPRLADSGLSLGLNLRQGLSTLNSYQQGQWQARYAQQGFAAALLAQYAPGGVAGEGWGLGGGVSISHNRYTLQSGTPQADMTSQRKHTLNTTVAYRQVDDHIDWFSGLAMNYAVALTPVWLGSSFTVLRQTLSLRSYVPFDQHDTVNLRLNLGHSAGAARQAGLFDLGNRSGLRGYIPGEIQATAYALASVEGRFLLRPDANVQTVVFSDVAAITGSGTRIRIGAGSGIRWTLRWLVNGTIRGDIAWGFATRRWRFYLASGQAF